MHSAEQYRPPRIAGRDAAIVHNHPIFSREARRSTSFASRNQPMVAPAEAGALVAREPKAALGRADQIID